MPTAVRLLGIYFLVEGALYLPGALPSLGVGLPEGSSRWPFVAMPLLQGIIAMAGGFLLLRGSNGAAASGAYRLERSQVRTILQLMGVYFLVHGLLSAAVPITEAIFVTASWEFRAGQMGSAAVALGAGLLLTMRPDTAVHFLNRFAGTSPESPPLPDSSR